MTTPTTPASPTGAGIPTNLDVLWARLQVIRDTDPPMSIIALNQLIDEIDHTRKAYRPPSPVARGEWPKGVIELARTVVNDIRNVVSYGAHMSYADREAAEKRVLEAFTKYGETVWTAQQLSDAEAEADEIVGALRPPSPPADDTASQIARDFIEHGKTWITDEKALQLAKAYLAGAAAVVGKPSGAELALHINNWVIENRLPMTVLHSMQLAQHLHAAPIWPTPEPPQSAIPKCTHPACECVDTHDCAFYRAEPPATVDDEVVEIARKLSFAHPEASYTSFAALAIDTKKLLIKLRQRAGSGVTLDEWRVWFGRQDASVFLTPTRFATAITEFITGKA